MPVSVGVQPVHSRKRQPPQAGAPIVCHFGVEVTRSFETAGEAAVTVHRDPYHLMHEAHAAMTKWMAANN